MAANDQRVEGVPHFDIHITEKNLEGSAKTLISHIKKKWKVERIKRKVFEDGISNSLFGYYVLADYSKDGVVNMAENRSEMVLVRIYGKKTEMLIDRAKELRNFQLLQKNGLSPRLFCTFENGYCYGYVEGTVLGPEDFSNPDMYKRTAKLMARVHSVKIDQDYLHHHKLESNLFETIKCFIRLLPAKFNDVELQSRFETKIPAQAILKEECAELENMLKISESPIVFSHNDALCANFIFNEEEDKLWLIDYEYASPNYAAFDIGNHFNEFAGVQSVDYSRYPSKEMQFDWIRIYLEEIEQLKWNMDEPVTEQRVKNLYHEINRFSLASHLLWGVWAVVQAYNSEIDFDFLGYAIIRLNEYFRRKPEVLSLTSSVEE